MATDPYHVPGVPRDASPEELQAEMERKLREQYPARGRAQAREDPAVRRVTDLIDGLEDLSSKLDRY